MVVHKRQSIKRIIMNNNRGVEEGNCKVIYSYILATIYTTNVANYWLAVQYVCWTMLSNDHTIMII